jgi:hypothetical protein
MNNPGNHDEQDIKMRAAIAIVDCADLGVAPAVYERFIALVMKQRLKTAVVAILDDDNGINLDGYEKLLAALQAFGMNPDGLNNATECSEGRVWLHEQFAESDWVVN